MLPFFSDERVIRAAGGAGALSDWLLRHVKSCQWPVLFCGLLQTSLARPDIDSACRNWYLTRLIILMREINRYRKSQS
ncbi:hypothetical protein D3822_33245 [Escherichia coli]|nr:hypothetical protein D3822_33245 [Escherichia coli]